MSRRDDRHAPPAPGPEASAAGARAWPCRQLPFLALSATWLAALHAASRAHSLDVIAAGASMLLLGAPICLAGVYASTLRRQYRLALFRQQGWLYALLSRRLLSTLFWMGWAGATSLLLLARFHVYTPLEWALLAALIPMFACTFAALRRLLLKELRVEVAVTEALVWSRRICPALMLVVCAGVLARWGETPQHASFEAAIDAHGRAAAAWSGSALVGEALHWGAYFDGLEAYALGRLRALDASWALLAAAVGNLAIFYNVCLALSCFRIPRAGFAQARLAPRSAEDVFAAGAVTTFVLGFVYFPLLANLDDYLARSPDPTRVRTRVAEETTAVVRQVFERIDDGHYRRGTLAQLAGARRDAAQAVGAAAERLRQEVGLAFERLERDAVEEYLDWYYSLAAEYGRLGMLLQGRLEGYLAEKVGETFRQAKWYQGVDAAFSALLRADADAAAAYARAASDILDRNRVVPEHPAFDVALTASLADIVQPSFYQDFLPAGQRLAAAGVAAGVGAAAAGGVTFLIVQKVTAKVLGKYVLKMAARAPLKAVAGKVAGAAAGGAAIGSLAPGMGTAVGAVVGGAVAGASIGVAVDGALLELEEALSRDDFRRELAAAVREARREFEGQYLGYDPHR